MFNALLNNPAIIKAAAKAAGIQAARLDYNQAKGVLWASLRIHGRIVQHQIPTGRTFTLDEILTALFRDADLPSTPAARPGRVHLHGEIEIPIGQSPP